jgi:hypothetical protein
VVEATRELVLLGDGTVHAIQSRTVDTSTILSRVVDLDSERSVLAGDKGLYVVAARDDGSVWTWGGAWLEHSPTATLPAKPEPFSGLTGVVRVRAGYNNFAFLDKSGGVTRWHFSTPDQFIQGAENFRGLAEIELDPDGGFYTLGRLTDGSVRLEIGVVVPLGDVQQSSPNSTASNPPLGTCPSPETLSPEEVSLIEEVLTELQIPILEDAQTYLRDIIEIASGACQ